MTDKPSQQRNLGTRRLPALRMAQYPNVDPIAMQGRSAAESSSERVDLLLVNPPTPDGGLWIRSQHRVGRRTRENMVWPQVSLAQMAAMLMPRFRVAIIDANAERMGWEAFRARLHDLQPRYYLTQVTAPTLENDMYGCFLAKAAGAETLAFGTHVTPLPVETLRQYPVLDYVLVGEPELTLCDLLDHMEQKLEQRPEEIAQIFDRHDSTYQTAMRDDGRVDIHAIKGLAWRDGGEIVVNAARPFIADLDDLPIPRHDLLPWKNYRMPLIKGPFTFIVPSRGCPAGCIFCIKHVSYQYSVRVRSPQNIFEELGLLYEMGIRNVHMYADLFTASREQVVGLCKLLIAEKLPIRWTCNSRVDYVDQEMLQLMAQAGCWFISWGIESANEAVLRHAHKGVKPEQAFQAIQWSKAAGIKNWGYFIIGLPGETEASIRETIDFAKCLPLDIALFHIAAPYPGTPFFDEVIQNGWFRPGTRWEQVDMDKETVLDYEQLSAEQLMFWQKKAFRAWALRPGPMFTYLKMLASDPYTFRSAWSVGMQHPGWLFGNEHQSG